MATPLDPGRIVDLLRAEGLEVYEMPGWREACRCHDGGHQSGRRNSRGWGSIHGITAHITTSGQMTGNSAISYCRTILMGGNGAVPGPLCLAGIDGRGRVIMTGAGRTNHVGEISSRAAEMMKAAAFPLSGYTDVRGSGVDGNAITYGFEMLSKPGPNSAQQEAFVRAAAAICRAYGWDGREVHGHGEVSSARSYTDPGLDMGAIRARVGARIGAGASADRTAVAEAPAPTYRKDAMYRLTIHNVGIVALHGGVIIPLNPDADAVVAALPGVINATITQAQYDALRSVFPTPETVDGARDAVRRALADTRFTVTVG